MNKAQSPSNRLVWIDILRVLATIAVIMIHVSTEFYYSADVHTLGWQAINFYDGICRWSVPVFVMISGALFLHPSHSISIHKLYSRNILRLGKAFLFWSLVYTLLFSSVSLSDFVPQILSGYYHMWFILMTIGLYMLVPVWREITASPTATRYFLALGLAFVCLLPFLMELPFLDMLLPLYDGLMLPQMLSYSVYFVLGFFLSTVDFSPICRRIVYILGIIGLLFTAGGAALLSILRSQPTPDPFYSYFFPGVMLQSSALFLCFRYSKPLMGRLKNIVVFLSQYTFGIYLIHVLILKLLHRVGISVLLFPSVLSIPVITLLVFVLSFAAIYLLSRIPIVRRFVQ